MQPAVFIRGRKVTLGPVDPADAEQYSVWVNDPRVRVYLNRPYPQTVEEERRRVEGLIGATDAIGFSIRLREDGRLIGRSAIRGIHSVNRSGVFTIFLGDPATWSGGLGTEATALTMAYALDVLNLNRLELEVFAFNERAVRAYERLGFVREGVRREAKFHDGGFHDAIVMAIVSGDWRAGLRDRVRAYADTPAEGWAEASSPK
ncbi:MAG: GNAT family N-acetyltransferase [Acidobacteria bacterium]|nr:GNAT family N-acetyltransferase [Acidobacteriota bacterium]